MRVQSTVFVVKSLWDIFHPRPGYIGFHITIDSGYYPFREKIVIGGMEAWARFTSIISNRQGCSGATCRHCKATQKILPRQRFMSVLIVKINDALIHKVYLRELKLRDKMQSIAGSQ
jgi:hypothetical protein